MDQLQSRVDLLLLDTNLRGVMPNAPQAHRYSTLNGTFFTGATEILNSIERIQVKSHSVKIMRPCILIVNRDSTNSGDSMNYAHSALPRN